MPVTALTRKTELQDDSLLDLYRQAVLSGRDTLKKNLSDLAADPLQYLEESAQEVFPTPQEAIGIVEDSRAGRHDGLGMDKIKNLAMGLIFAGPGAKTADLASLNVARRLEAAGASADEILANTGWFKGLEGKWKFEIADDTSRFSTGPMTGGKTVKAPDVLDHPALYEAYPFLRNTTVSPLPADVPRNTVGMFQGPSNPSGGKMYLDPRARRDTSLHEMQHGIQEHEGFALGGAPTGPSAAITGEEAAMDLYRRLAGEIEARNVQARMTMTPERRKAVPPWTTEDTPAGRAIVRKPVY